ncbi:TPA: hypothetical protein ACH3X2_000955 [Trebouxia sp. C0005]
MSAGPRSSKVGVLTWHTRPCMTGRSSRTWPYQRITAAEAASHEGKNKAQALQADLTGARQAAVDLKVHVDAALARLKLQLDAAVKENTMLD